MKKNKPNKKSIPSISETLSRAAELMAGYQDMGMEAFTVLCIHEAEEGGIHNTAAQQFFRSLFAGPEYWQLRDDGTWDWDSRLIALLLAAEIAAESE